MLTIMHTSPRGWLGSGQCHFWLRPASLARRDSLARRARLLGACGVQSMHGGHLLAVWPHGCIGSRLFDLTI